MEYNNKSLENIKVITTHIIGVICSLAIIIVFTLNEFMHYINFEKNFSYSMILFCIIALVSFIIDFVDYIKNGDSKKSIDECFDDF